MVAQPRMVRCSLQVLSKVSPCVLGEMYVCDASVNCKAVHTDTTHSGGRPTLPSALSALQVEMTENTSHMSRSANVRRVASMGKDRRDAGPPHCISVKLTILDCCALGPAIHLLAEAL